ncbi:MAG: hypothetical protein DMF89_10860 [Acidobacteria bacterium]|nr:MAG: hypothetical protein DMF89_10860 [Acidobacteriota bacterium]
MKRARRPRPDPVVDLDAGRPALKVPDDAREAIAEMLADLLLDYIATARAGTDPREEPAMITRNQRRDVVGDLLWPPAIPDLGARRISALSACADCISTGVHEIAYGRVQQKLDQAGHVVGREFVVIVRHENVPSETWVCYGAVPLCRRHARRRSARACRRRAIGVSPRHRRADLDHLITVSKERQT